MRLPEAWLLAAALWLGASPAPARADAPADRPALSASAVMAAASAVQADPLMGGIEKGRTLRFKPQDRKADPNEVNWWVNLFKSLSTGLRVVIWLLLAGLFILVLLRLRDWLRRTGGAVATVPEAPTHIGSLDIRPESLPDDIGAAARALLDRGALRAALSLLYRGALSRLVHVHGVPIRAASTERDCLALAAARLAPPQQAFLAELVASWQAVAYAHRELPHDDALRLCQGFASGLAVEAAA